MPLAEDLSQLLNVGSTVYSLSLCLPSGGWACADGCGPRGGRDQE